jgi:hypothetical protein
MHDSSELMITEIGILDCLKYLIIRGGRDITRLNQFKFFPFFKNHILISLHMIEQLYVLCEEVNEERIIVDE